MGLQGRECSSHFRLCGVGGTETHFRGTHDCGYKGVSPDTQFYRLGAWCQGKTLKNRRIRSLGTHPKVEKMRCLV